MSVSLLKRGIKERIKANKELKIEIWSLNKSLELGKKQLRRMKYELKNFKIGGSK